MIERSRLDAAEHFARAFLDAGRNQLEARGRAGLVRDCHGDLRAEHVIAPERGDIYIYDCIEFNPELRQIDVAADIAFLVMDLTRLGAEPFGRLLVEDYRGAGGDPGDDALLLFFASYRAWVRAKVACIRAQELHGEDPEANGSGRGRRADAARPPVRLAFSRSARARDLRRVGDRQDDLPGPLAELSGWQHLSSDVIRKRRAGLEPTERGGAEVYSHEPDDRDLPRARADGRQRLERHLRRDRRRDVSPARGARCLSRRARRSVSSACC